jgi:hypothetical protein
MTFVAYDWREWILYGQKRSTLPNNVLEFSTARTKITISASVVLSLLLWLTTAPYWGCYVMHADFLDFFVRNRCQPHLAIEKLSVAALKRFLG